MIELLVVITIIAVLMALLLPVVARAKFITRVSLCTSNLHQWGVAVNAYALDANGKLPRFDIPVATGRNLWDVSSQFIPEMSHYCILVAPERLTPEIDAVPIDDTSLCPLTPMGGPLRDEAFIKQWGDVMYHFTGYSWWVPRLAGKTSFPLRKRIGSQL